MKKKILASLLLSTVLVSQTAVLTTVRAETTDEKIAAQDNKISSLTEQQQEAQKQVDQIQGQVSTIQAEQASLQAENEKLQAESKKLEGEITELSKNIVARNASLEKQARSAQTNGAATSYINTIVNSKSITEAISRVAAMSEIVSANNKMLEQQKADKKAISDKQVANNEAINTVIANQQKLADDAQALTTKQAELKVAELNLAAEKATAEGEKATLLEQKAAAEAEAKAAHIGKYIHSFDEVRTKLTKKELISFREVGEQVFKVKNTPLYNLAELQQLQEQLLAEHREYESEVNYYKAQFRTYQNNCKLQYEQEHQRLLQERQNQVKALVVEKTAELTKLKEKIASYRIIVPNDYKNTIETLLKK